MSLITISNSQLTAKISTLGAELQSVKGKDQKERIWQADKNIWGRHAPVLFPIVGALKNDQYKYDDEIYKMTQHGFARDHDFKVKSQTDSAVTFELEQMPETLTKYPFNFILDITFELHYNSVFVTYSVFNDNDREMTFSIGGHPGFKFNYLDSDEAKLVIQNPEQVYELGFTSDHLIDAKHPQQLDHSDLPLNSESFVTDTLTYQNLGMSTFSLYNGDAKKVELMTNSPFVGVWSPYHKDGNFVCLEPWWGIADTVSADGNMEHKFGVNKLQPKQNFNASWNVSFY